MQKFKIRRTPTRTGVIRDEVRKKAFDQRLRPVLYQEEEFNYVINSRGFSSQWDLIEDFCWLHIPHNDVWERKERKGSRMPHVYFKEIGMSEKNAITDEDEFVLEFGTKEEKRNLIASVSLSTEYRITETGIQHKVQDEWEDVLLHENKKIEKLGEDE